MCLLCSKLGSMCLGGQFPAEKVWKIILYSVCTGTELRTSVGWDNVDSIVTCYGLDGLGIELQREQDFLHLSRLALVPPDSCTVGTRTHSLG